MRYLISTVGDGVNALSPSNEPARTYNNSYYDLPAPTIPPGKLAEDIHQVNVEISFVSGKGFLENRYCSIRLLDWPLDEGPFMINKQYPYTSSGCGLRIFGSYPSDLFYGNSHTPLPFQGGSTVGGFLTEYTELVYQTFEPSEINPSSLSNPNGFLGDGFKVNLVNASWDEDLMKVCKIDVYALFKITNSEFGAHSVLHDPLSKHYKTSQFSDTNMPSYKVEVPWIGLPLVDPNIDPDPLVNLTWETFISGSESYNNIHHEWLRKIYDSIESSVKVYRGNNYNLDLFLKNGMRAGEFVLRDEVVEPPVYGSWYFALDIGLLESAKMESYKNIIARSKDSRNVMLESFPEVASKTYSSIWGDSSISGTVTNSGASANAEISLYHQNSMTFVGTVKGSSYRFDNLAPDELFMIKAINLDDHLSEPFVAENIKPGLRSLPIPSGQTYWYPLKDSFFDYSGKKLTVSSSPIVTPDGVFMDGVDDYLILNEQPPFGNKFTISLQYRSRSNDSNWALIGVNTLSNNSNVMLCGRYNNPNVELDLHSAEMDMANRIFINEADDMNWHTITIVCNFDTGGHSLWYDGKFIGVPPSADPNLINKINDLSHPMYIGAEADSGGMSDFFPGTIKNLIRYDRELTPSEIMELHNLV